MLKMNMHIGSTLQLIFLPNYIRLNLHEFMIETINIQWAQAPRKILQTKIERGHYFVAKRNDNPIKGND